MLPRLGLARLPPTQGGASHISRHYNIVARTAPPGALGRVLNVSVTANDKPRASQSASQSGDRATPPTRLWHPASWLTAHSPNSPRAIADPCVAIRCNAMSALPGPGEAGASCLTPPATAAQAVVCRCCCHGAGVRISKLCVRRCHCHCCHASVRFASTRLGDCCCPCVAT